MLSAQEFDGASRGNPGRAGAGAALLEDDSNKPVSYMLYVLLFSRLGFILAVYRLALSA